MAEVLNNPIRVPLSVASSQEAVPFGMGVKIVAGNYKMYEGEYEVTPSFETQALETAGLAMAEDVTVFPIPVSRASNPSGGKTVIIGG